MLRCYSPVINECPHSSCNNQRRICINFPGASYCNCKPGNFQIQTACNRGNYFVWTCDFRFATVEASVKQSCFNGKCHQVVRFPVEFSVCLKSVEMSVSPSVQVNFFSFLVFFPKFTLIWVHLCYIMCSSFVFLHVFFFSP